MGIEVTMEFLVWLIAICGGLLVMGVVAWILEVWYDSQGE